jgi:hypothetical protein
MLFGLGRKCRVEELLQFRVAAAASQYRAHVEFNIGKKARAQLAVGGQPQAITGCAEMIADGVNEANYPAGAPDAE